MARASSPSKQDQKKMNELNAFMRELQPRMKDIELYQEAYVPVYVCHPGASKTSFIRKDEPFITRMTWVFLAASPLVQSAEQGAYPELMCATEEGLNQAAYYGPTGWMYWTGPVGECQLEPFAKDRAVANRLWAVSEEQTGQKFDL